MTDGELGRFLDKIVVDEACWIWTGAKAQGYGELLREGRPRRLAGAHRLAYEHFRGPIPRELQPDHLCRRRACVNPAHLELVTVRENVLRGHGPAAVNAAKTTCKRGHPLAGDNLRPLHLPVGHRREHSRICRTCQRLDKRASRARRAAA